MIQILKEQLEEAHQSVQNFVTGLTPWEIWVLFSQMTFLTFHGDPLPSKLDCSSMEAEKL